ncbi:MAG: hypothetical protein ACLPPV_22385 [Candidatus Korobacteraceae bacterium]|jgi:DUF4097 and DUF4098 domain-containing protein YvlB
MADRKYKEEQNHQRATQPERRAIKKSSLCVCASVVVLAVVLPVCAQQSRIYRDGNSWVEEITGTMPAARELHVTTDLGSVQVQGNSPRVSYLVRKRSYAVSEKDARKQFEQLRVSAVKMGESDSIEGKAGKKTLARFGAEFIVQVPRDLSLVRVQTRSGSLAFSSIAATIVATTGAGLIKLDDLAGPVKIASGGGNVEAGNLGSDLTLTSGAADVRVANVGGLTQVNLGGGRVYIGSSRASTIQTGAGSIQVQKCLGDLHVVSGGGNLYLGDVDGAVKAETEGGSVRLSSATGPVQVTTGGGSVALFRLSRGAQVETGAGPITVEFIGNHGFADSFLHTAAGDVAVCFASNLPVTVHATSDMASGNGISSEFPGLNITKQGGQWSPRSMSAEGAINGGGPALRIRTTIGQIAFRRCQ